jgi:hypothetical protein
MKQWRSWTQGHPGHGLSHGPNFTTVNTVAKKAQARKFKSAHGVALGAGPAQLRPWYEIM